jgi:hypothetical protein
VAPGGGRWQKFESLVFPDGPKSGPIFTARLLINTADGVSLQNNRGLWAVDSGGELRLLLRTGEAMSIKGEERIIKGFNALLPQAASVGGAQGYDDDQHVAVLVTFTDRTEGIVRIAIP